MVFYKKLIVCACVLVILCQTGCLPSKSIINENDYQINKKSESNNPYGFEKMKDKQNLNRPVSLDEYEMVLNKTKNILQSVDGEEIVVKVNDRKVTRSEFESTRTRQADIYSYTTKETVYSFVKAYVIVSEAERLNLQPDREGIDAYMLGIKEALEEENAIGFETEKLRMQILNITSEEYLEEQEKLAYEMFMMDALYKYIDDSNLGYTRDEYVYYLLKTAEIKIYDPQIEKECLEN